MQEPEYMRMNIAEIPEDIIKKYNLHNLTDLHGNVHFKITKGMYGLKQAAILAYQELQDHLAPYGNHYIPNTVGMWKHTHKRIQFCLCVDDFGVKYTNKQDVLHLLEVLQQNIK